MKNVILHVLKRIGASLVTIFVISVIIFIGVELLPGDVADTVLGQSATPETVEALRKELKLDLPPHTRYVAWLKAFVQGDFGNSLANHRPVAELITWRFGNTLFLAGTTALIAVPLAILLGIWPLFTEIPCMTRPFPPPPCPLFLFRNFLWPISSSPFSA